jgi:hypothetical protein
VKVNHALRASSGRRPQPLPTRQKTDVIIILIQLTMTRTNDEFTLELHAPSM